MLPVGAGHETQPAGECTSQLARIHAGDLGVDGVHPDLDEVGDDLADHAVAVEEDVLSAGVDRVEEPLVGWLEDPPPEARVDHQPLLRSPVVAKEQAVHAVSQPDLDPLEQKLHDPISQGEHLGALLRQIDQEVLESPQVEHALEECVPVHQQVLPAGVGPDRLDDPAEIPHLGRIREPIRLQRRPVCQGMDRHQSLMVVAHPRPDGSPCVRMPHPDGGPVLGVPVVARVAEVTGIAREQILQLLPVREMRPRQELLEDRQPIRPGPLQRPEHPLAAIHLSPSDRRLPRPPSSSPPGRRPASPALAQISPRRTR